MTKSHPQDDTTRTLVECFCEQVFWLRQIHYIVCELFRDERASFLMKNTAHAFFLDLNKILIDYFLLEVAKLTDPARSSRGKRENFTLANLIETVEWPSDCLDEIERHKETITSFRKCIEPARNRLIAHHDKTSVVSGDSLGSFTEGQDERLLEALEQICNLLHRAAFGVIFGDMVSCHSGDVRDLKKALRKAIAFDRLLSDSKGDDLARLVGLLHDVVSSPAQMCRTRDGDSRL